MDTLLKEIHAKKQTKKQHKMPDCVKGWKLNWFKYDSCTK